MSSNDFYDPREFDNQEYLDLVEYREMLRRDPIAAREWYYVSRKKWRRN